MKILLVDDDPLTLEALDACLRSEGFPTLAAKSGTEALALWERHRPNLICLDIMMANMDGYEVCRQIRAKDTVTPILFLSAKKEEIDVVLGFKLGADDFVRKPFGKLELLARIRSVLRRAGGHAPKALCFQMHDLTVYPNELRAERKHHEIELSAREVEILALLHENEGKPVNRDALLNRCWGLDYFPESRTLDQHIATLRKRIERDPTNPQIIETVRGIGYRYRVAHK